MHSKHFLVPWALQFRFLNMNFEYQEEYIRNSRGVNLFTCKWLLPLSPPKALIFLCHGYGMECSNSMKECGIRLARAGYGVFGIDYEGHGRSSGARCYVKKFEDVINDCDCFFKSICAQEEYMDKSRFLYGESMGGAVALLVHKKSPNFWNGAVLVAPMCKISEKLKPHPLVVDILTKVEPMIPKWKIVPTKDVIDSAFKDPIKRSEIRNNKLIYQDKPRMRTALEMLRTSIDLEKSLNQVTVPFLVLHGEADTVTDPEISKALYEKAGTSDKTMKLYPGMWHALTLGETNENVEIVFTDIVSWLDSRAGGGSRSRTPILTAGDNYGIEKVTGPPPPTPAKKKNMRVKFPAKYLCGLKGQRLEHHSTMENCPDKA